MTVPSSRFQVHSNVTRTCEFKTWTVDRTGRWKVEGRLVVELSVFVFLFLDLLAFVGFAFVALFLLAAFLSLGGAFFAFEGGLFFGLGVFIDEIAHGGHVGFFVFSEVVVRHVGEFGQLVFVF